LRLLQDMADVLGYEVVLRPKSHRVPRNSGAQGT